MYSFCDYIIRHILFYFHIWFSIWGGPEPKLDLSEPEPMVQVKV